MQLVFVFAIFIVAVTAAPPNRPTTTPGQSTGHTTPSVKGHAPGRKGKRKDFTKEDKDKLLKNCQKKGNKCQGQTDEYKKTRADTKAFLVQHLKTQNRLSDHDASAQAETQLNKIQDLKKKINAKYGLSEIEPADTGLWQKDIILTDDQISALNKALDNPRKIVTSPDELPKHKRSAATFFEKNASARWSLPIHYWISNDFSASEKATIDSALTAITQATTCITFAKDSGALTSGSQIQFIKVGSTSCSGTSYVGYVGVQPVNLATTSWCSGDLLKGLVLHEVIHALGGDHEQSRTDRDEFIDVLWENIDPQEWSQYEMNNDSTTYGVQYDYQSVMHYGQGTFGLSGLNTMTPHDSTMTHLGGDSLTQNDILQLKRMHCKASTCLDLWLDCGVLASFDWCTDPQLGTKMITDCPRSCGVC